MVGIHRIGLVWQDGTHAVRFSANTEGELMPLWAGAAGKLLLAYADSKAFESVVNSAEFRSPLTDSTLNDPKLLSMDLERIRKQGHAISLGERISESAALAVPIYDYTGGVITAMALISTIHRFSDDRYLKYLPALEEKSKTLSLLLGARFNE